MIHPILREREREREREISSYKCEGTTVHTQTGEQEVDLAVACNIRKFEQTLSQSAVTTSHNT
jgi:hypothetical protein